MSTPTTYTPEQRDSLQSWCVFNAVFAFIEEYGKEEGDFINWLQQRGTSFSDSITHCADLVEVYAKQLSQEENK
jgi:hypothetical protein